MSDDIEAMLAEHRCEFSSDGDDECSGCNSNIPKYAPVYFLSDGGMDCREGDYFCETCLRKLFSINQRDTELANQGQEAENHG